MSISRRSRTALSGQAPHPRRGRGARCYQWNTSTPGGYGIVSKLSLFMTQYATMRLIGVRRRAQMTPARLDGG